MKRTRATSVQPKITASVQPTPRPTEQPSRPPAEDRLLVARQIEAGVKSKGIYPQTQTFYLNTKRVEAPELDADGQIIPDI